MKTHARAPHAPPVILPFPRRAAVPAQREIDRHAIQLPVGWIACAVESGWLTSVTVGHRAQADAERALDTTLAEPPPSLPSQRSKSSATAADVLNRIENYLAGTYDDFFNIPVITQGDTDFQRSVYAVCRKIPLASRLTYGEVATAAGFPGAARAVGSCMARNRLPIIIPCHRVVGSGGSLGGYSGAGGIELKKLLLALEAEIQTHR